MMLNIPYYYGDDLEYAHKRLSSTYVLTSDNNLFYVNSVKAGSKAFFAEGVEITGNKKLNPDETWFGLPVIEIPVTKLNLAPLELGYIFSRRQNSAVYLSRLPARNLYKQGLHQNGLVWSGGKTTLCPDELIAPVFNKYDPITVARERAQREGTTHAFSRAFAIRHNGQLEYLGKQVVGQVLVHEKRAVPVLAPKFIFLQQHLDWSAK